MRISYMQIMNNLMQTGLTVSLAALVPLLLRRVLKKRYPARAVCLVWALLALRLLVPVQLTLPEAPVQVTPRTTRDGVTARLAVRCGDDTQLYEMTAAPDGSFAADGIVFTVGSTYELSVQWTADGVTTNETLGTVDFNDEMTEPQIIWGAVGSSLDFGYSVRRVGIKQYRLTLTCYPVEVQVDAPPWMQPAQVEIDLRLNGDAGEPTATAVLDCEGESSYGNSSRTESVWNGTFYSEDVVNGWEYDGETLPKYVVRVTDTNGDVWTEEMPLSKR